MSLDSTTGPKQVAHVSEAVDYLIENIGTDLVVGTPLGIGKPIRLLDTLYERARRDPAVRIHFLTALTLAAPSFGSDLEKRLLEPVIRRVEGTSSTPQWVADLRSDEVPPGVKISEFYFSPGAVVEVDHMQRWHLNSNYTDVVRDCLARGINVVVQSLAVDGRGRLSLASNPDITLDLLAHMTLADRPTAFVGVVNERLPFTGGDAVLSRDQIDVLLEDPDSHMDPFPLIAEPVTLTDYAIGLQAAALVPDGGTIQLGIGSMADAVASALIMRQEDPDAFRRALAALGALERSGPLIEEIGGLEPFETGLYASSEMLSDALLALYDSGIIRRRAFPDEAVQRLYDAGSLDPFVSPEALAVLRETDIVSSPLSEDDLELLSAIGLVGREWHRVDAASVEFAGGFVVSTDLDEPGAKESLVATAPGETLNAPLIHGAFYLGSVRFYERLRSLSEETEGDLNMTAVGFTNSLDGTPHLKRTHRQGARFINQAMKVSADGALSAHTLESGRTVSGVGGLFDFVEMARRLEDGRAVMLIRSTRTSSGREHSNVVPEMSANTIPGQLKDILVTEYGIADLRGRTDGEVVERLVSVADARFQGQLVRFGKQAGKIPPEIRSTPRPGNTPDRIASRLQPFRDEGFLPTFPFGSDLTEMELDLARVLRTVEAMRYPIPGNLPSMDSVRAGFEIPDGATPYLERLGLRDAHSIRDTVLQRLVVTGLVESGVIETTRQ